jgi:hypothetical protein
MERNTSPHRVYRTDRVVALEFLGTDPEETRSPMRLLRIQGVGSRVPLHVPRGGLAAALPGLFRKLLLGSGGLGGGLRQRHLGSLVAAYRQGRDESSQRGKTQDVLQPHRQTLSVAGQWRFPAPPVLHDGAWPTGVEVFPSAMRLPRRQCESGTTAKSRKETLVATKIVLYCLYHRDSRDRRTIFRCRVAPPLLPNHGSPTANEPEECTPDSRPRGVGSERVRLDLVVQPTKRLDATLMGCTHPTIRVGGLHPPCDSRHRPFLDPARPCRTLPKIEDPSKASVTRSSAVVGPQSPAYGCSGIDSSLPPSG